MAHYNINHPINSNCSQAEPNQNQNNHNSQFEAVGRNTTINKNNNSEDLIPLHDTNSANSELQTTAKQCYYAYHCPPWEVNHQISRPHQKATSFQNSFTLCNLK